MSSLNPESISWHEDPNFFMQAVNTTSVRLGFPTHLIERDYYCTLLLARFSADPSSIVFKGGTCLAKVHAVFYRLSEDLDFAISMPVDATRSQRRKQIAGFKNAFEKVTRELPAFSEVEAIRGSNLSRHYSGTIAYSPLFGEEAEIKIEVGLREPLLTPSIDGSAQTALIHPISGDPFVPEIRLPCISKGEAFAEKLRAALTRRTVAIRDFFDIDYAVRKLGLKPGSKSLISMVRKKLAIPGNDPVDVGQERMERLRDQLDPDLRAVLRDVDFGEFDIERAIGIVVGMARKVV